METVLIPFNRDLERQLRRLGVKISNIDNVKTVLIEAGDKEIVLEDPQVMVMEFRGQKIYQIISSKEKIISLTAHQETKTYTDEDIEFIMSQTGLSREKAKELLEKAGGDIAKALMIYEEEKK
jgi:nascent polypeptide-associated complex subunit alpha